MTSVSWKSILVGGTLAGALSSLLLISFGCASTSRRTISSDPSVNQDAQEKQVLTEWQEERQRNYFDWPVDEARMTRGYLPNRRKPHLGVDLAAPKGTPVLAAHDGRVIYAGRDFRGFGKMVLIEGKNGWATLYAHFSKIQARQGERVSQGDQIGLVGRTGHATGYHLHFEIRKARGPVDPLLYLPGGSRLAQQN